LLQHPDGKAALEKGDADAWAGLDPFMAQTELEQGSRLFFRDPDLNTYGFLNVREEFAKQYPDNRRARAENLRGRPAVVPGASGGAARHRREDHETLRRGGGAHLGRNDLSTGVIGETQRQAIVAAGGVLKENDIIPADTNVDAVARALIDPQYIVRVVGQKAAQQ